MNDILPKTTAATLHEEDKHMLTTNKLAKSLSSYLNSYGIDIVHVLALSHYNSALPSDSPARIKLTAVNSSSTDTTTTVAQVIDPTVVLIGNSRRLWDAFIHHHQLESLGNNNKEYQLQNNPLEHYLDRHINAALATALKDTNHRYRVFWSHRQSDTADLKGGGYIAIQRMAEAAGIAYLDHTSHLCFHPIYGPWFSLRAAIVVDSLAYDDGKAAPMANPCDAEAMERIKKAVLATQQAYVSSKDNQQLPEMADVKASWKLWLAVRDAAFPNHPWRYRDEQILYHYTGAREVLIRQIQAYQKEQSENK